ncbi:uncharacterized protein Z519_10979 [Cladophialophora bantiana CBS 173.52]|uniref:Metallo-beta-lactamase domain-containing protein n=1 Tax=Cladophialophora bantiana (strain ATCC 10958 / CBS 173.52 / CDC B-1940 / NIH 8579) TaxID=1442370 RepID=A0A0D2HBW3_CLAB1|nr:uncharacterized protein Z519_10979 [Cladophialophora bantiana CBS 173.52]KIW88410.1 hypothetical protein Z519_10979 [Cladophialophora bantiana CBS 173.52]
MPSNQDASMYMVPPKTPPALNIPPSNSTVSVKIIDSTSWIDVPLGSLMGPGIPGHDKLSCPSYCFLIEHGPLGRKILFDLGTRKDWENLAPNIVNIIKDHKWGLTVEKNVSEILTGEGVDLKSIEAIIWSHWHYDHTGDPSTFPSSTKLIVGPGFKDALTPGYPVNQTSQVLETDWQGRELVEVDFSASGDLTVGGFKALDYFGDGSFYIVDAPGHAIGHVCGLARVTPDSFIFMGGDACHHGGEYRPTKYLPLPKKIDLDMSSSTIKSRGFCPGSLSGAAFCDVFNHHQPDQEVYILAKNFSHDTDRANLTIQYLEEFDAADNVFVIIAHDTFLLQKEAEIDFFPHGTLNDWKAKRLNEKARWLFLKDFAEAAEKGLKQETEMGEGIILKP